MKRLLDIHSHILPGVDDGAYDVAQTEAMLLAAKQAGICSIIATPHLRTHKADIGCIRSVFQEIKPLFERNGLELRLGFECYYGLLLRGLDMREFTMADTNVLLLELMSGYLPLQWENSILELQQGGLEVIIAHPERYTPIQHDIGIAERMVEIGCELQVSVGSLHSGMFSKERKCALALLDKSLVSYLASDAHCAEDYHTLAWADKRYGGFVKKGMLLSSEERRA